MIYIVTDDETKLLAEDCQNCVTDLRGAKTFETQADAYEAFQNLPDGWKIIEF